MGDGCTGAESWTFHGADACVTGTGVIKVTGGTDAITAAPVALVQVAQAVKVPLLPDQVK